MNRNLLTPALVLLLAAPALVPQMAQAQGRKLTPPPGGGDIRPVAPEERASLMEEVDAAAKRFSETSAELDREMKSIVLREVKIRRSFLEKSYGKRIDDVDVVQRQRRLEAIAALQSFVDRYPNHPDHTPDAMFRLAELYYEKAQVDNDAMSDQYDRDMDLYRRGKIPAEPVPPKTDYSEAIKLYGEIVRRFRDYRYLDVAFYMKGYTEYQSGREREARDTWLALAKGYPKSQFAPEAWMRVGEHHFDYGEWQMAEKAYTKAAEYPDSKFYHMVLYKLAWTYFQQFDYDRAIKGFKQLIALYDQGGKLGGVAAGLGGALRDEAIQYLARSLAEDDWNGDGEVDPAAGVPRALAYLSEGLPYEVEILEEYAKSLYDLHEKKKYGEAIQVYKQLIDRDPLNRKNPELHERLIEVYAVLNDIDGAIRERDDLVTRYARGTPWYKANMGNAKSTSRADRLVEVALRERGRYHHAMAQRAKAAAKEEGSAAKAAEAIRLYEQAAEAYRAYLKAYPHDKEAYEIGYQLAEALYYAEKYLEAAVAYSRVRDVPNKEKYRETAAFSTVTSVEQEMERLVKRQKLPKKALALEAAEPPADEEAPKGTNIKRMKPKAIPEVVRLWVQHSDKYVEMGLVHPDEKDFGVQLAYRVALVFFNFDDYEEARKRFEAIVNKWPTKKEAAYAAMNIVNSFKTENDWPNIEKWTGILTERGLGDAKLRAELEKQIKAFKLGQQFEMAERLYADKRYVEAAKEFERVVRKNPTSKVAHKALFNAAVAYQDAKHWSSAARVFEEVVAHPLLKDSKFREDSLFYLAENHRKFFSLAESVQRFLGLLQAFPRSERAWYALHKSAELEEMQGNYARAADLFQRYSTEFHAREDAAQSLFRAGLIYEKMGDKAGQMRTWREFLRRYAKAPGVDARIVEANLRIAVLHHEEGSFRAAKKFFEDTLAEFKGRGQLPGSPAATFAARAQFELVDVRYRAWEGIALKGSLANQGRTLKAKRKSLEELEAAYIDVFPFKAFDWTVAAYFRVGQLYQNFAQTFYKAPEPTGLTEEEMDEYRTMLEDEGLKWENEAIKRYEVTVEQARRLKIVNEWTLLALKFLNRYKPDKYPLFKAEKRVYGEGTGFNVPLGTEGASDLPPTEVPSGEPGEGDVDEPKVPPEPLDSAPGGPEPADDDGPGQPAVPDAPSAEPDQPPAEQPPAVRPAPVQPPPARPGEDPEEPPPTEPSPPQSPPPDDVPVPDIEPLEDGGNP